MKTLTINIPDEYAAIVERYASDRGLSMEAFLAAGVERDMIRTLVQSARSWMPRSRWDGLVRGEECSICRELQEEAPENEEGFVVCDLEISRLRLMRSQFVSGYCVLACLEHVREPYELEPAKQFKFFTDMTRAGRAIETVFKSIKMNFEIQGNSTPHLHCHIKPRYYGDHAPGIPIDQNARTVRLSSQEYKDILDAIRKELS